MDGIGKTLLAAGHKTNYHEAGEGEALFLLHGSGPGVSGWTKWSKSMAAFSDNWRVIVPDIAGFGFTEFQEGTKYDIKLWVNHLVGIMDALDIEKASFVGNSFGGAVAIGSRTPHEIAISIMAQMIQVRGGTREAAMPAY